MDKYFGNSSSLGLGSTSCRGCEVAITRTFKIPKSAQLSSSRVKCSCSTPNLFPFLLETQNKYSVRPGGPCVTRRLLPRRFQMSMTMRRAAALGARHILASSAANSRLIGRRHVRPLSPQPHSPALLSAPSSYPSRPPAGTGRITGRAAVLSSSTFSLFVSGLVRR
jgi:hypothetical protein